MSIPGNYTIYKQRKPTAMQRRMRRCKWWDAEKHEQCPNEFETTTGTRRYCDEHQIANKRRRGKL